MSEEISHKAEDSPLEYFVQPYLQGYEGGPIHRIAPKMGRNDVCPLKNIKFKKCCGANNIDFCQKLLANYFESQLKKNGS